MVCNGTKKRTTTRLKLTGSLENAKTSVRVLRTKRNLRSSVNESVQSNVSQRKSHNVSKKKQIVSLKRQSITKAKSNIIRKQQTKTTKNKTDNASESEESEQEKKPVKPKKGVALKKDKKATKKTVTNKRKNKPNDSITLRQMSLKESFTKQRISTRLRPREKARNYSEETKLSEKTQSSSVLAKVPDESIEKGPVYKRINTLDDAERDRTDVYDFKFDDNDSRERKKTRKKKKGITTQGILKANLRRKAAERRALKAKAMKNLLQSEEIPIIKLESIIVAPDNNVEHNQSKTESKISEDISVDVNASVDEAPSISANLEPAAQVEQSKLVASKPRITCVKTFKNMDISIVPLGSTTKDAIQSFRAPDIFARPPNQYKSMVNHSLLNRSLSPIVRTGDNFDVGSPWRPPQFSTFSHVRDLFQSTPQVKKLDIYTGRIIKNANNIENIAPKRLDIEKGKKIPLTRKFGTEITNIDSSIPSSPNVNEDRNEQVPEPQPIQAITETDLPVIAPSPNVSFNDVVDDKENAAPNFQTPKKLLQKKKKKKKQQTERMQTLQNVGCKVLQSRENEPQPGPSGLQQVSPVKEDKVLRQSNLSGFLSLTPMPQSSKILTRHGIFSDVHSTPINGKQPKNLEKDQGEMENAFGFDSESDLDISPINGAVQKVDVETVEKPTAANVKAGTVIPARLSVGEIQRKLLVPKRAKNKAPLQSILKQLARAGDKEQGNAKKEDPRKKVLIDVSNFSDTFDVLSETGESLREESFKDFPLFVDLEPSRFTGPAKHSYKRKRNVRFNFSDGSDFENDERRDYEPETKKKKVSKLSKADEKRLKTWVKNVNQTFDEIDQFDLVIE